MTAKFGAARRRAFLSALEATGNQTLAAERAKVSRSWVTLHRASDPDFRRAIDDAAEAAKAALRQAQPAGAAPPIRVRQAQGGRASNKPPTGWGYLDGEELVVKGTGGSGGGKRVQIARSRLKQWSPRVEKRFLESLSATCNVKAACAEVGLTPASAYAHRRRWQGFADKWKQALDDGYAQLEAGLVFAAGNFLSGEPEVGPITGVTMAHALEMWEARGRQERARTRRRWGPGLSPKEPDIEDIRAHFERVARVIMHHDPERLAKAERQWKRRRGA